MNTCGTCRFFGERAGDGAEDIHVPNGYHVCRLIEMKEHYSKPRQSALVVDGSGYFAALCVKEEFGCNQWQANSASVPQEVK